MVARSTRIDPLNARHLDDPESLMISSAQPRSVAARIKPPAGKIRGWAQEAPRCFAVACAICVIALISGCAATGELANPPRVSLADLRLAEVNFIEQRYAAKLRVQNPNDADLSVRGMEYTISINGRKFADGVNGSNFSVPAYSETIIEVNLTSTVLRVFEQLQNLSNGESRTFRYSIAGRLSLDGLRASIPFSHEDVIDLSVGAGG
jgi:LEA14-like dessication related protein